MDRGLHVLHAGLDPLDRLARALREEARQGLFAIDVELAAEATAHVRRDHAQLGLGYPQHDCREGADEVRDLGGGPERDGLGAGVVLGHDAARLDGDRGQAAVLHPLLDHAIRPVARLLPGELAALERPVEGQVVVQALVDERRAGRERGLGIGRHGQRVVLNVDELERVTRGLERRRDDRCHRLADEARLALGQDRRLRRMLLLRDGGRTGDRAQVLGVLAGDDVDHAGMVQGSLLVDRDDARMGEGAAQDRHVVQIDEPDVVDVGREPADHAPVLLAAYRLADQLLGAHDRTSSAAYRTASTMCW